MSRLPFISVFRKPAQRAWFVVAVIGVVMMIGGMVGYAIDRHYFPYNASPLYGYFDMVFDRQLFSARNFSNATEVHAFQRGGILTIVGGVFAYLYDYTLGALIRWIRNG